MPWGIYSFEMKRGHKIFVLYREVVLSSEVKMYQYNREGTSKCVLYREVVLSLEVKMY